MQWSGMLNDLRELCVEVDEYVDEHKVVDDLSALNQKYTPDALQDRVKSRIDLIDRALNALVNDPDLKDSDDIPTPVR